jgi:hypothetical protein
MCIATQVLKYLLRASKRTFSIRNPFHFRQCFKQAADLLVSSQGGSVAREDELLLAIGPIKAAQVAFAELLGQRADPKQIRRSGRDSFVFGEG